MPKGLVIKASEATPRVLSLAAASAPILGRFESPGATKRLAGIGEEKLNHQVQQEHDVHHAIKSGPKLWHLQWLLPVLKTTRLTIFIHLPCFFSHRPIMISYNALLYTRVWVVCVTGKAFAINPDIIAMPCLCIFNLQIKHFFNGGSDTLLFTLGMNQGASDLHNLSASLPEANNLHCIPISGSPFG